MDYMYQTVDKDFVETIVGKLKSQGIFDQFRKDCLADVDTKPAYQNLQERVNGTVNIFLEKHKWQENLNKTQLRESLRRHVQQGFLETGVDRIVDQVVNPKIYTVFKPKVEDVVYDSLGIPKPNRPDNDRNLLNFILKHPLPPHPPPPIPPPPPVKDPIKSNVVQLEDLLPMDLDPISPGSVDDLTFSPKEDEQNNVITNINNSIDIVNNNNNSSSNNNKNNNDSSAFELIGSNDESKLSLSDLTSHDSTKNSIQTGPKSDAQFEIESNTNSVEQNATSSLSPFKNFSNLNEKIKQAEIKLGETEIGKSNVEISNDLRNCTEVALEQDFCEKQEKEECSFFKIFSEDSTSSLSSIGREKKSVISNSNRDISKYDEIFYDSQRSDKMDECDSSVSNIEKLEIKTDSVENKEVKSEKRRSESSSSKQKSRHHIHDSKRDKKHHNRDYKKDYKSRSSKPDKDRRHHDDRHKECKDRREGSHKENRSKDDTDNEKPKHGDRPSKHRESDDKLEKVRHRDSSEKHREERVGKSEKSTERSKHKHGEDKRVHQDKSKLREGEEIQRDSDTLSMDIEDNAEYDLNDRTEEYEIIRDNETEENSDMKSEKESEHQDYEEKSDKHIIMDYEKEEKVEKHEKSRHKEEKQDKVKSKESDDKQKESKVRSKEGESKQRSEKSAEKLEKSGKQRDCNDRHKEERSSKSEKIKHKEESGEQQKEDKERNKDVKNRHSVDTESATMKEDRNKSDERDPDKERTRKHSDKSKSRHSSSISGKHTSDKEEKKDKEARKRKGERCEEVKVKESRRSSDRDHYGPGSSFSNSSGKTKDSTNNSYSKTNETLQDQGREGSSSIEENTDSLVCIEQANDVDILLMKINDSIENDLVKNNRNDDEKLGENVPLPLKKPKIANNIFEIKKIMQARRNIEKMEALESLENNTINVETHEDYVNQINEADSSICQAEDIKEVEIVLDVQQTEDVAATDISIENLTESLEVIKQTEEVRSGKLEEFVEDICESASIENERQPEEVVVNVVAEPSFLKRHRIANNIYEVRKIMQMKKRLEKKQKQAALLEQEHRTVDEATINNNKDNHEVEEITEEQLMLENENCIPCEGDEDNIDISASNLAKESDITKALEENQSSDTTIVEEENSTEECPGDNVENVEPKTLKTPRIARNIFEVRKIIRARKALKRKLKLQTKNYELNINRKHMMKSLLNSKKLLNVKRKSEQIVKLKLITKEKKNRLKRDNNSRKILNRKENSKVEEMGGKEVVDCAVPCDEIEISANKEQQNLSESVQETHNWPEVNDGFLGFTKKEIDIACNQLEVLKRVLVSNLSKHFTTDTHLCNNQLDGNSNMVKSSTSLYNNRKEQTIISVKTRKNNTKLTTKEEMNDGHDKVVRDILNGKNGCSIKLTKSTCLDEQAKYVSTNKRAKLTHNNVEDQNVEDINSNLEDCNNINETKKFEWSDRILSTSLTEDVLDNLMKENNLIPEDSLEYAESPSNSEENFKIMAGNKNTKPKEPEVNNGKSKVVKSDGNTKVKVGNCAVEVNLVGKECSGTNSHGPASKVRNNTESTQHEKQKRSTRMSFRSTQRYDSEDLYKPRLALSQNSSRTRFNRSETGDGATRTTSTNACPTLPNLRRKVR